MPPRSCSSAAWPRGGPGRASPGRGAAPPGSAPRVRVGRGVPSVWACLAFAVVVVGLYALVVAYFATARRGIYFALLTLIFAEVVYTFFRYTQTFGGSDGIQGLPEAMVLPGIPIDTPLRK